MTAQRPRRHVLRFAIVVLLCLLLGAVTTVAMAWGFVASATPSRLRTSTGWEADRPDSDRWPVTSASYLEGAGVRWALLTRSPEARREPTPDGPTVNYVGTCTVDAVIEAGWPLTALRSSVDGTYFGKVPWDPLQSWQWNSWSGGIIAPESWRGLHPCLPCDPLWPGFAIDSATYTAAWCVLLCARPLSRLARRRSRLSRGMCGSCGYDLKGSNGPVCPECGKAE